MDAILIRVLPVIARALPWILIAVLGVAVAHCAPVVGYGARLDRLEADRDAWKSATHEWRRAAGAWRTRSEESESARAQDVARGQLAMDQALEACSRRVAEARRSARAVERIVTREPSYDENHCPVRGLVDPDSLRDALRPPAG